MRNVPSLPGQAVVGLVGAVAQHEAVLGQLVGDRDDARQQPLVVAGKEPEDRGEERRGVERVGVVVLAEDAAVADAACEDVLADRVGRLLPGRLELGIPADLRELRSPVERDPAHQLRGDVVLRLAARLPDPLVGLLPDPCRALRLRLDDRPEALREALASAGVEQDRIEDRAEDVVLALVEGPVPDPHRASAGVPREMVQRRFGEVAPTVDPVHDLQGAVVVGVEVGDELHELVGLPVEVQEMQRLERERRVAHPRVAVVPVALAAGRLGQRRGQRGDRRSRRHVREPLDHERGALDRVTPGVIGDPRSPQPGTPEARRRGDPRLRLVDVGGCRERFRPRQHAVRALAHPERVASVHAVPLDAEREIRPQADRQPATARVGRVPVAVDERPFRGGATVVERRLGDDLDLDLPVDALDRAHEHVIGVVVGRGACVRRDRVLVVPRPHRQGVPDHDPSRRRLPGRHQHVRPRLEVAGRGMVDPVRPEPEESGLPVEQAAEDARRVEGRDAEPVDRPVRRHERTGVAVGEERVVRDRRERRRRGRALLPRAWRSLDGLHDTTHGPCQPP